MLGERTALEGEINAFSRDFKLRKDAVSFVLDILDPDFAGIKSIDSHFPEPAEEEDSGSQVGR